MDFKTTPGGPIIAPFAGTVSRARPNPGGFGTNYPLIQFGKNAPRGYANTVWYIGHIFADVTGPVQAGQVIGHTGTGQESWMGNAKGIPGHAEIGRLHSGGGYPSMSEGASVRSLVLGGRSRFTGPPATFGRGRPNPGTTTTPVSSGAPSGAPSGDPIGAIYADYLAESQLTAAAGANVDVVQLLPTGAKILPGSPSSPFDFLPGIVPGVPPGILGGLNPFKSFDEAKNAVTAVADFLKFIAWIFHPRNILRVVEFLTGITIMAFGLHYMLYQRRDRESGAGMITRRVINATPAGRTLRVARGRQAGRREVRAETHRDEYNTARKAARTKERRTQNKSRTERNTRERYGDDVPF